MRGYGRAYLLAACLLPGVALAQGEPAQQPPAAAAAQPAEQFKQLMEQETAISDQLADIQREAVSTNPEIQQQIEEFQGLLISTMQEQGHDPVAAQERLVQWQEKLADPEVAEAEKQSIVEQFQAEQKTLYEAQQQAYTDPEVRKDAEDLQTLIVTTMRETNPRTDELIDQRDELRQQITELARQGHAPLAR